MLLWYYFTVNTDVAYRTIHYCFHTSKFHRKYASWSPRTNSCTRKVYTMCFTTAWFFRNGSKRDLPATTPSLGPPQEELWLCFSLALAIGTSVNVIPWPQVEAWGLPCWKHRAWPWACTNHQLCEGSHLQVRTPDDQTLTCEPWQHRTCPANSLQSVNSKLQIKCLY